MSEQTGRRIEKSLDRIVTDHGGELRCTTCGARRVVDSEYFRVGWPTCCRRTMQWVTARQLEQEEAS